MTRTILADCELRELPKIGDHCGSLISCEAEREIPFGIARVYYLFGTTANVRRGYHAHLKLRQFAVCLRGSCIMVLDDGHCRKEVVLDHPNVGLTLPPMIWHEMYEFTSDCILLVFADAPYDESDYIRDYDRFLSIATGSDAS